MLVFHSHCQMGNQMFIYACARSLSRKRKLQYCLSSLQGLEAFELAPSDKFNKLKFLWFRLSNLIPGLKYKFSHLQDNRLDYLPAMLNDKNKNNWYYGYFQGERYLLDNFKDIQSCFRLKNNLIEDYRQAVKDFPATKEIFAIHIRLRDYKTFGPEYLDGPDMTLPFNYYHTLIKKYFKPAIHQLVFLSDDIKPVSAEFQQYFPEAIFSNQTAIIDFQIMMHAKIAVISHSSFAWWASWLNPHPDKVILVPEYFLGFKVEKEFPIGMIPSNWTKINVKQQSSL